MSHAIRRHHRERLKAKRKYYHTGYWSKFRNSGKLISFYVDTPTPCSCDSCGNQRHSRWLKVERLTIQERRFLNEPEDE